MELRLYNLDLKKENSLDYSDHCMVSIYDANPEFSKKLYGIPISVKTKHVSFCIKNHNSHYYNQTKNILPFDVILNNNHVQLIAVLEKLLERSLNDSEITFVAESLHYYHSKQPQTLINNYIEFMDELEKSAMNILAELKSKFKPT